MITIQESYLACNKMGFGLKEMPIHRQYIGHSPLDTDKVPHRRPLKTASYLDAVLVDQKNKPGPKYIGHQAWYAQGKNKLKIKYADRKTFMDLQPNTQHPGVGKYNVTQTQQQTERQLQQMKMRSRIAKQERKSYIDQVEYLSANNPGVGDYNIQIHPKSAKKAPGDPKFFREKHQVLKKSKSERLKSHMSEITPLPQDYQLFASKKTKATKRFGYYNKSESRFKSKGNEKVGPGSYTLGWEWRGKQPSKDEKKHVWYDRISKGPRPTSVYYS